MTANYVAAMFLTGEGHDHRGYGLADELALDDFTFEAARVDA